jgi:hypothetical protein
MGFINHYYNKILYYSLIFVILLDGIPKNGVSTSEERAGQHEPAHREDEPSRVCVEPRSGYFEMRGTKEEQRRKRERSGMEPWHSSRNVKRPAADRARMVVR